MTHSKWKFIFAIVVTATNNNGSDLIQHGHKFYSEKATTYIYQDKKKKKKTKQEIHSPL